MGRNEKTASTRSIRRNVEMAIQRELIKWLHINYADVEVIFRKNEGLKSLLTAILDELSGLVAGVPDLQLLTTRNNFTYILELELKKKKGALSPSQKDWHSEFISTSNRKLATGYGLIQAQEIIKAWVASLPQELKK